MNKTTTNMYGISRIDNDRYHTHAWRVSLRRRGKSLVKNFPDKKHGGNEEALQLARSYRDYLLAEYPPLSRKEFSSVIRSNNNSGITGVYKFSKKYTLANSQEVESWYWEAHWPTERGESRSERFSVNRYGDEIARAMAIRTRNQGLEAVKGTFWASERGDPKTATTASTTTTMQQNIKRTKNRQVSTRPEHITFSFLNPFTWIPRTNDTSSAYKTH